jgi:hypothetical protein
MTGYNDNEENFANSQDIGEKREISYINITSNALGALFLALLTAGAGFIWDMHGTNLIHESRLDHTESHNADLQQAIISLQREIAECSLPQFALISGTITGLEEYVRNNDKEMERVWETVEKLRTDVQQLSLDVGRNYPSRPGSGP